MKNYQEKPKLSSIDIYKRGIDIIKINLNAKKNRIKTYI